MIERASACVEPAAQHLFRRLEVPTRSRRVLHEGFWRHGGDNLAGPAWWPEYLHTIRRSSQARFEVENDALTRIGSAGLFTLEGIGHLEAIQLQRYASKPTIDSQTRYGGLRQDRSYSRSCKRFLEGARATSSEDDKQGPHVDVAHPSDQAPSEEQATQGENTGPERDASFLEDLRSRDTSSATDSATSAQPQINQYPRSLGPLGSAEHILSVLQERPGAYDDAWRAFISLQEQEEFAPRILEFLSGSRRRIDHERAVRAYKLIPLENRTESVYANAMRIANTRRSQQLALEVNREAVSRSLGNESSRILFAHLVGNNLWNTLSQAFEDVKGIEKSPMKLRKKRMKQEKPPSDERTDFFAESVTGDLASPFFHSSTTSDCQTNALEQRHLDQRDELWTRLWADVDSMRQLPEKVLLFARRIESASSISPLREPRVQKLADSLLYRVVGSSRIMGIITGTGFTSLFKQFFALKFLSPNHYYQAIRTLLSMVESRNRSQLAALAYRNLRYLFPKVKVPPWIFGSLISIFTDARQPSHALRFLLDEFASLHKRPDAKAYQKVLTACARLGDVESVYEIFQQYTNVHGQPKILGFLTPLIYVHARIGDVSSAQEQFDRLSRDYNLTPDTYCWNILLAAHARAQDPPGAFKAFGEMRDAGVSPDAYSFGTLMGICANTGDTETVHRLVDMARKYNIRGTTAMVDTLVHSYCLNDELDSAKSLVEAATSMELQGSPTRMWNTLLRHCAFQADSEGVLEVQNRMREMAVKPDSMTYAALMSALVVIGKTKDAAQILRSLHFSENLTATLFHYSIVLHGYAQEGNRDMVAVIYNEILERFPRASMSAKLAVLHTESGRDVSVWRQRRQQTGESKVLQMPRALDFLADILLETSQMDLAVKDPQPGFQRRSPVEALPSIYMEFLINALNSSGAFYKAEKLLSRCRSLIETSYLSDSEKTKTSIQLLTAYMIGCIKEEQYKRVDDCWNMIVTRAVSRGQQLYPSFAQEVLGSKTSPPPSPFSVPNISLPKADQILRSSTPVSSPWEEKMPSINYAQRYVLSAPLTRYMQALSTQKLSSLVPSLVEKVQKNGFALSSKNWNTYIQVLAQSADPKHQLHAFELFEAKLLPNMPPWPLLRRGKWAPKPTYAEDEQEELPEPVPRKFIEKFRHDQLVPTYFTMVQLGAALMKFQRRGAKGESMNLRILRSHAPGTVEAVTSLPYLRDRVQGLLLRGRDLIGDLVKRPRRPPIPDRSGLRGSKSPLDHIPIDHVNEVRGTSLRAHDLQNAESYGGEILRQPAVMERTGQTEFRLAYRDRTRRQEREKLAMIQQIRRDAKRESMVSDIYIGEPNIASTNFKTKDNDYKRIPDARLLPNTHRQSALLNEGVEILEKMWETRRENSSSTKLEVPRRLRIKQRQYPRRQRLAIPRSQRSKELLPTDARRLTFFKPPVKTPIRQLRAFPINKRAIARRKDFQRRELTARNKAAQAAAKRTTGQTPHYSTNPEEERR